MWIDSKASPQPAVTAIGQIVSISCGRLWIANGYGSISSHNIETVWTR